MEKKVKRRGKWSKKPEEVGRKNLRLEGFNPAEMKETGKTMKEYLKDKATHSSSSFLRPSFSPGKKRRENPPPFRKHQHQHSL